MLPKPDKSPKQRLKNSRTEPQAVSIVLIFKNSANMGVIYWQIWCLKLLPMTQYQFREKRECRRDFIDQCSQLTESKWLCRIEGRNWKEMVLRCCYMDNWFCNWQTQNRQKANEYMLIWWFPNLMRFTYLKRWHTSSNSHNLMLCCDFK